MMLHIGILHWNRPEVCLKTVASFLAQGAECCLTVIDNGSKATNIDRLAGALPSSVRLIRLPKNLGWGKALNVYLRQLLVTETEGIVGLSAQDTFLTEGCLQRLDEALKHDPGLGMVCPQYESGHIPVFSRLWGPLIRNVGDHPAGTILPIQMPHGTLCLFRLSCLRQNGLFDERYFAYGDETEIGLRAGKAGWKVAMVYGARILNPERATPNAMLSFLNARNSLLTMRLHAGRLPAFFRIFAFLFQIFLFQSGLKKAWFGFEPLAFLDGLWAYLHRRFGPPPDSYFSPV